jgi:hypothetical protein
MVVLRDLGGAIALGDLAGLWIYVAVPLVGALATLPWSQRRCGRATLELGHR